MPPIETIEQAIEALERCNDEWISKNFYVRQHISNLRALLEQMKKQEPVAKVKKCHMDDRDWLDIDPLVPHDNFTNGQLLYTAPQPPQREGWQLDMQHPLSGFINQAKINATDSPHVVVEKLEAAMLAAAPKPTEE